VGWQGKYQRAHGYQNQWREEAKLVRAYLSKNAPVRKKTLVHFGIVTDI
jgi:hypothetical protein